MKTSLPFRLAAAIFAAALVLPVGLHSATAQDGCWDNAAIQSALSSGQIQPVAAVLAREGIPGSTEVLSVKVCEQGGSPVYIIAVLEASGQARNLTISAR